MEEQQNQDDFKLDTRFTDSAQAWQKPAAVVTAFVLVVFIVLTMTTNIAEFILPMDDAYLSALIPRASDNAEPLSLKALNQVISDNAMTIQGRIENRTDFTVSGLLAVIQPLDIYGVPLPPVEVVIFPADVPAHMEGTFDTTVALKDKPSGYSVKFRLVDGPFIPHKDERAAAAPTITAPTLTQ